jgi:UDPglucose 6-dehydrogenase
MERARAVLGDSVRYADSVYAACDGAEAVLILTEWEEFANLDLALLRSMLRYPIVVDGRNLYSLEAMREAGLQYYSVGRPAVGPVEKAAVLK